MHQAHDLRVDGRFGYFIGELGYYCYLVTERSLQPGQEVLAVVVVLIEHADLGIRLVLQDVLPEGFPLHLEARIHRYGPGKFCGSAKRRPPAETKMCGTLAPFRYF